MKTGILVHGFHLYAQNWQRVVWGDAPQNLGRLPQALLTAHSMNADVIVLGTGASKRQFPYPESERYGEQLAECEFTLEYLKTFFNDMLLFEPWVRRVPQCQDQLSWQGYKADILSKIKLDFESENTVEELQNAGEIFRSNDIDRVMLVSSPTHIVRVLRDANDVYQNDKRFARFRYDIHAIPCSTCYDGTKASDVIVLEPPHRPDRKVLPTFQQIRRLLALEKLQNDDLTAFVDEFDELLEQFNALSAVEDINVDRNETIVFGSELPTTNLSNQSID